MTSAVRPVPRDYHAITPYLIVADAAGAIGYYQKVFGAEELVRMEAPGGKIGHAEFRIRDCKIMIADEFPEMGFRGPKSIGGTPVTLHLYVDDVDATVARAVDAGATITMPVQDQFWGDRSGTVDDFFGHRWHIATRKEEVSPEEMARRSAEFFARQSH